MFIRILNFQIRENKKTEVLTIMDNIIPKIRSLKGCVDCMFIMNESDDHYALLVFWDSKQDADTAASFIGPQLIPALNRISKENVTPRLYEVYQPVVLQEQR
jgi:quinol monooxygenase YgiN